jgi:iron-sulfur cluster repair protein YtfE (RIC family)
MMTRTTQFHEQHGGLVERAELLAEVARELAGLPQHRRSTRVKEALVFLQDAVVPHTWVDERVLYPWVSDRLGDPLATATMSYDHVAMRGMVDDLANTDPDDVPELQRLLYGLHALIGMHIWKEERLYLAMLERPAWPST